MSVMAFIHRRLPLKFGRQPGMRLQARTGGHTNSRQCLLVLGLHQHLHQSYRASYPLNPSNSLPSSPSISDGARQDHVVWTNVTRSGSAIAHCRSVTAWRQLPHFSVNEMFSSHNAWYYSRRFMYGTRGTIDGSNIEAQGFSLVDGW